MSAYLLYRGTVTNPDVYKEYMKLTPDIIAKFGGKFLARGGKTITLEGNEETRRVIVVEFPSFEQAVAFYNSPEYQAAVNIRKDAAITEMIIVDGV